MADLTKQENVGGIPQYSFGAQQQQNPQSKYAQLLAIIEELGKDIRPTYTGNKMSVLMEPISKPLSKLWDASLPYNADGVCWCPSPEHNDILACCMYELSDEKPENEASMQQRLGGVKLMHFDLTADHVFVVKEELVDFGSGVFRAKWVGNMLYCALTDGNIGVIKLGDNEDKAIEKSNFNVSTSTLVCIDVKSDRSKAVCSNDKGMLSYSDLECHNVISGWRGHDLFGSNDVEVWSVAFDAQDNNLVYSGGDDSVLKVWDLSSPLSQPSASIKNIHSAGVTKVVSSAHYPNLLFTGSYDEHLRVFDKRNWKEPVVSEDLHGGVWDIDFNEYRPNLILSACMYDGWKLLDFENGKEFKVIRISGETKSLLYGCSFSVFSDSSVFAVCSFYDKCVELYCY